MSDEIVAGLPENALEPLLKRLNEKCSHCGKAAWGFVEKTQISSDDYLTYVCTACGEVKRSLKVAHLI